MDTEEESLSGEMDVMGEMGETDLVDLTERMVRTVKMDTDATYTTNPNYKPDFT